MIDNFQQATFPVSNNLKQGLDCTNTVLVGKQINTVGAMKYSCILLLVVLVLHLVGLCNSSLSKHYYIVPVNSTDTTCREFQKGTCLTLEQLAQLNLTFVDKTNLTLSFLPGEHFLTQSLTIHSLTQLQIIGMNEPVVRFHGGKRIEISQCEQLYINGIVFIQFPKNMKQEPADYWNQEQHLSISHCQTVHINNCSLMSIDKQQQEPNNNGDYYYHERSRGDQEKNDRFKQEILSAVVIKKAKNITLGKFIAKGNHGKVVHIESLCNVTILDSEFTENVGDTVYIHSTNALISDSNFHSNTGGVLTIDSATTFIAQCNITNNINLYDSILLITPHNAHCKQADNTASDCSVPSSYSVVTSDTALHVGSKNFMHSRIIPTESSVIHNITHSKNYNMHAKQLETICYTTYHCTDISDVLASDLGNVSGVNDIIYDFTKSNTSRSHSNKGRFCVNTDHRNTLPVANRVIFSDNKTSFVLTEFESNSSQDNSSRVCDANILASKDLFMTAQKSSDYKLSSRLSNDDGKPTLITITNNTSHFGRELSMQYHHINKFTSGSVLITSCSFTNNTNNDVGGVIGIRYSKSSESSCLFKNVFITSCSFTNNTSQILGGAVLIYSEAIQGNVLITSCSFTNNTSQGLGGAICIFSNNSESTSENVLISSSSFTNNTSDTAGGAISIYIENSEPISENVLITSCSFTNNTSQSIGGAVSIYSNTINGNVLVTFCSFTNNTSKDEGGAISLYFNNSESTLENVLITSCSFSNNTSNNGGAISIVFENIEPAAVSENVIIAFCSFTDNTGKENGGAISLLSPVTANENVLIASCYFTNNTSKYYGGAFCLSSSVGNGENIHFSFCSFTNNTSSQTQGGAVYINSTAVRGNILITSCSFINNTSQNQGGAVYIDLEGMIGKVLITACTFTNNTSQSGEGAFYKPSQSEGRAVLVYTEKFYGNVLITFCSFTNNTSQGLGGAICIYSLLFSGNVHINSCSFTNNTSLKGGAITIPINNSVPTNEIVRIHSCSFANNTSQNGGGIVIFSTSPNSISGQILITSCSFVGNSKGAIVMVGLSNVSVIQTNITNSKGSIIYLKKSTVTFLDDNHFRDNNGSVYALSSELNFEGKTVFRDNYNTAPIYVVESQIHFNSPHYWSDLSEIYLKMI